MKMATRKGNSHSSQKSEAAPRGRFCSSVVGDHLTSLRPTLTRRFRETPIVRPRWSDRKFMHRGSPVEKGKAMEKINRVFVVMLVGSVLAAAAIWGGAEASAPGVVQFMYIGFLALFGAALAAGVRKE